MLTHADSPTIRFAINRRLDKERGVRVGEIKITPHLDASPAYTEVVFFVHMPVLPEPLRIKFHLPEPFEHRHLLNEIDESAEKCKEARLEFWRNGGIELGRNFGGTGLRGGWKTYG
jgi:hypothetical protein